MIADDFEADFCKDVFEPAGLALRVLEIETAFYRGGYWLHRSELSPHRTPIMVLYMRRETAPEFDTDAQLAEHVSQIVAEVGLQVRKRDLTAQQTADRILVAFPWRTPPRPKRKRKIALRELLAKL